MPSRRCPVCGQGMFRPKQLMRHVKLKHGFYHYSKYIAVQGARSRRKEEE